MRTVADHAQLILKIVLTTVVEDGRPQHAPGTGHRPRELLVVGQQRIEPGEVLLEAQQVATPLKIACSLRGAGGCCRALMRARACPAGRTRTRSGRPRGIASTTSKPDSSS